MSRELIYTSAPKGLASNSRGFCTVAVTAGTSRQHRTALESLCGYEFLFNVSDPQAHLNPVNFAHTVITTAGQTMSVLSRVAACGTDYSGRSNKIAHHFLLSEGEKSPHGPAWMLSQMSQDGYFCQQWQEDPHELGEGNLKALSGFGGATPSPSTQAWQQLAGDGGWAGELVRAFRENPRVPAFVIVNPGTDVLPLFHESLALLPVGERWGVGFSTYYSVLPSGCTYHWRGVLSGTKAAREVQRFHNATVIDLTQSLGAAPQNPYTDAAREGRTVGAVAAKATAPVEADVDEYIGAGLSSANGRPTVVVSATADPDPTPRLTRPHVLPRSGSAKQRPSVLLIAAMVVIALAATVITVLFIQSQAEIRRLRGMIAAGSRAEEPSAPEEILVSADLARLTAPTAVESEPPAVVAEASRGSEEPEGVKVVASAAASDDPAAGSPTPEPTAVETEESSGYPEPPDQPDQPVPEPPLLELELLTSKEWADLQKTLSDSDYEIVEPEKDNGSYVFPIGDAQAVVPVPSELSKHYVMKRHGPNAFVVETPGRDGFSWKPLLDIEVVDGGRVVRAVHRKGAARDEYYGRIADWFVFGVITSDRRHVYWCRLKQPTQEHLKLGLNPNGEPWRSNSATIDYPFAEKLRRLSEHEMLAHVMPRPVDGSGRVAVDIGCVSADNSPMPVVLHVECTAKGLDLRCEEPEWYADVESLRTQARYEKRKLEEELKRIEGVIGNAWDDTQEGERLAQLKKEANPSESVEAHIKTLEKKQSEYEARQRTYEQNDLPRVKSQLVEKTLTRRIENLMADVRAGIAGKAKPLIFLDPWGMPVARIEWEEEQFEDFSPLALMGGTWK